jgi:hypothetical protein
MAAAVSPAAFANPLSTVRLILRIYTRGLRGSRIEPRALGAPARPVDISVGMAVENVHGSAHDPPPTQESAQPSASRTASNGPRWPESSSSRRTPPL